MRTFILVFLALNLGSCQVDYEDNERIFVKGSVSDSDENPISGLPVDLYAGGGISGVRQRIGTGRTTTDGTFSVVALSPKEPFGISVIINDNLQQGHEVEYPSETINDVELFERRNFTYNLPNVTLEKLTDSMSNGQNKHETEETVSVTATETKEYGLKK